MLEPSFEQIIQAPVKEREPRSLGKLCFASLSGVEYEVYRDLDAEGELVKVPVENTSSLEEEI